MNITESQRVPATRFLTRARLENLLGELRVVKTCQGEVSWNVVNQAGKVVAGPFSSQGQAVIARLAIAERPTLHPANVLATGTTGIATADEIDADRADPARLRERRTIKRNKLRTEKWNAQAIAQAKTEQVIRSVH